MANALSGHGCKIYITLDPVASPNVFTLVPELTGDLSWKINHASKKTTPHDRTTDEYVFSNEKVRDEMTLSFNYIPTETTHTTVRNLCINNTFIGLKYLAPGGVQNTTDDVTQSGGLSSWMQSNPQFEGERTVQMTFRPSGPFRIDGTLYS